MLGGLLLSRVVESCVDRVLEGLVWRLVHTCASLLWIYILDCLLDVDVVSPPPSSSSSSSFSFSLFLLHCTYLRPFWHSQYICLVPLFLRNPPLGRSLVPSAVGLGPA